MGIPRGVHAWTWPFGVVSVFLCVMLPLPRHKYILVFGATAWSCDAPFWGFLVACMLGPGLMAQLRRSCLFRFLFPGIPGFGATAWSCDAPLWGFLVLCMQLVCIRIHAIHGLDTVNMYV